MRGPQLSSGLVSLAANHRLSPLCGFNSHKKANAQDLSQYIPGYLSGYKALSLTLTEVLL